MRACLVSVLALCFAGSGLAAPTQAVSSQLSRSDVAALQDLARRRPEVGLGVGEAKALLTSLVSDLGNGQAKTDANHRRQAVVSIPEDKDGRSGKGEDDDGAEDSPIGDITDTVNGLLTRRQDVPLDDVTDAAEDVAEGLADGNEEALGGLTDSVTGLAGGGDQRKGGLLSGSIIPGVLRRGVKDARADASNANNGPLSDITDTVNGLLTRRQDVPLDDVTGTAEDAAEGLTNGNEEALSGLTDSVTGLAGGGDQRKGGLLNGSIVPGVLRRGVKDARADAGTADDGPVDDVTDTVKGLLTSRQDLPLGDVTDSVTKLVGVGDDEKDGGVLGGDLVPGLLRRDVDAKENGNSGKLRDASSASVPGLVQ